MSSPPLLQLKYAFLNSWQSEPLSFICARQSFTVDPLLTQSDPLMQSISVSAISLQDAPILALNWWQLTHLNLLFAKSALHFVIKDSNVVRWKLSAIHNALTFDAWCSAEDDEGGCCDEFWICSEFRKLILQGIVCSKFHGFRDFFPSSISVTVWFNGYDWWHNPVQIQRRAWNMKLKSRENIEKILESTLKYSGWTQVAKISIWRKDPLD